MPTVFASHSLKEGELAKRFIDRLEARLDPRIRLLCDSKALRAGTDWHEVLRTWWYTCDAAVIVCSTEALTSDWVISETEILLGRVAPTNSEFTAFPVLIDPVTSEALAASPLGAHGLAKIEALCVTDDNLEEKVEKLVAQLNVLAALDSTDRPLGTWEEYVGAVIAKAIREPRSVMEIRKLLEEVDDAQWANALGLQIRLLARALMACTDRARRWKAVRALRAALVNRDDRESIMELIIPAAHVAADEVVPLQDVLQHALRDRVVLLGAKNTRIGHFWVNRACAELPLWRRVECKRPMSSDPEAEAFKETLAAFDEVFNTTEAEDIQSLIGGYEKYGIPVFVILPVGGVEFALDSILERFYAQLDAASFLILTPGPVENRNPIPVEPGRETDMLLEYSQGVT